ncbi:hypothetical protein ACLKA6_012891 [Drosophila palustris]
MPGPQQSTSNGPTGRGRERAIATNHQLQRQPEPRSKVNDAHTRRQLPELAGGESHSSSSGVSRHEFYPKRATFSHIMLQTMF